MIYKAIGMFLYFLLSSSIFAQELSSYLVFKSFQHTYPHKVKGVFFINEDWAITVGDETFYWAHGRLLPPELRNNWESYRMHFFSLYPRDIPDPKNYSPEEIESLRLQGIRETQMDWEDPYNGLQAALYGGMRRAEIEAHQVKTIFLGKSLVIHRDTIEALGRVDQGIMTLAKADPEIAAFLASINSIGGYNWRQIQGTRRMSYHSWGLALDIQPKQLGNKVIYWLWERNFNKNWMLVPLERRWQPPAGVIRAFENEGFIWGGRWALYDNMHFEYRPELHELNRLLEPETRNAPPIPDAPDLHHIYPEHGSRGGSLFQRILIYLGLKGG